MRIWVMGCSKGDEPYSIAILCDEYVKKINSITNVEGLTKILRKRLAGKIDEPENKILEMMDKSLSKFKETISDLTDVTKVQKNMDNEVEKVFFKEILEGVKDDLQQLITQNKAVIKEEFEVESIIYSKHNLRSILYNLLSNAIKYSSKERPVKVLIKTILERDRVILIVKDNGLGLNNLQQSKIFDMFKRLHTHVEGTGIRLYIIKRIIENNGGSIKVESELDKGTTFKVAFK